MHLMLISLRYAPPAGAIGARFNGKKTGFWKIARRAQVPVFCVAFNYPDRTIHLGPSVTMTEDKKADVRRVRGLFAGYHGKNHNV